MNGSLPLGGEDRQLTEDEEQQLFPATVRPAFLRLLWIACALIVGAAALVLAAIGGRLW